MRCGFWALNLVAARLLRHAWTLRGLKKGYENFYFLPVPFDPPLSPTLNREKGTIVGALFLLTPSALLNFRSGRARRIHLAFFVEWGSIFLQGDCELLLRMWNSARARPR